MFEGRKKSYAVASPQYSEDKYNYPTLTYQDEGEARIYIVVEDRTLTTNNDLSLYEGTYVGYTDDENIEKGWLIDERYVVKSVLPHRNEFILYLKDYEDGN